MESNNIKECIYTTIEQINEMQAPSLQLSKNTEELILGDLSKLDSVALINFLLILEETIYKKFKKRINLLLLFENYVGRNITVEDLINLINETL